MHLHDNSGRSLPAQPLLCRPGEAFETNDGRVVDVAVVVAAIQARPEAFEFALVRLIELADQIKGQTKLNFHHVATMARSDARRPLLLARTEAGLRLLDGRHRAARSKQLGYDTSDAWILSAAQLNEYAR